MASISSTGPRYITAEERAATRFKQHVRRKTIRRARKVQVASEIATKWPFKVVLENNVRPDDKFAIRRWMLEQNIRKYDPEIDNHEKADAIWNNAWSIFRFAKEEHQVLFSMCFT